MPQRPKNAKSSRAPGAARDLLDAADAICAPVDEGFLLRLATRLSAILSVDYVEIAALDRGTGLQARTLVLLARGEPAANMEYALQGTPCECVINGGPCCYPSGVQKRFPKDRLLAQMGVRAYAGSPLLDSFGRVLGLLAVMDTRPFADPQRVEALVRIFALRAALELERQRADRLFLNSILERVGGGPAAAVTPASS